jgi:cytochrome c oxidase assembly factor CtaG
MIFAHAAVAHHEAVAAVIVAAALAFVIAWWRSGTAQRSPVVCFVAAMGVLLVATSPTLEATAAGSFTGHMVQHLLLWIVVPVLVVVARPGVIVGRALARGHRGGTAAGALQRRSISRAIGVAKPVRRFVRGRPLGPAVVAWIAVVVTMYGTHLSGLYDLALRNPWVHEAEHAAYLSASWLLWWVVLGSRGRRGSVAGIVLAVATMLPLALLGAILSTANEPLYGEYVAVLGPDTALDDQRAGAALMWAGSMLATTPLLLWAVWRAADAEQRRAIALEQAARAGDAAA